jgi:hypothetical protein
LGGKYKYDGFGESSGSIEARTILHIASTATVLPVPHNTAAKSLPENEKRPGVNLKKSLGLSEKVATGWQ